MKYILALVYTIAIMVAVPSALILLWYLVVALGGLAIFVVSGVLIFFLIYMIILESMF